VTQVSWSNSAGGNGTASGTTAWSVASIALQPGTNVLTVTARDAASNVTTATLNVTYTAPDTTAPTVAITTPTAGASFVTNVASLPTLAGTSADNVAVTEVSWSNSAGGSDTASGTTAWSVSNLALQPGANVLTVTARDAANNAGAATLTVTYDAIAPTVSVSAPSVGATVTGSVTVSASAADNLAVAGVQFLLDGAPLGAELTASPYSMSWNSASATNGGHTLSARARDTAGNTTTSAGVAVTVSNTQAAGLVAAYSFNEGTGVTAADASGNNNTGVLSNATWTAQGRFGNALLFDGTSSVVTIASSASLTLTTGLTLEAWVYPTGSVDYWRTVIQKAVDAFYLQAGSNLATPAMGGTFGGSGGTTTAYAASALPLNTWSHLAATYDGAQIRVYVNGALAGSQAVTGALETNGNAIRIGANTYAGESFQGHIDEVRIYNRALSQAEIQTDMNTPLGGGGGSPDTTPPTVAITSPTSGATYTTGTSPLTLGGTASDNVGVLEVSWTSDRGGFGFAAGTTAWSAAGIPLQPGVNVLTVTARDPAGNPASAVLNVTYTGIGTGPDSIGSWAPYVNWPLIAIHAMLLRTGQVLLMDDHTNTTGNVGVYIWDPATETFVGTAPYFVSNLFCSGHAALPDGRMLVIGGHLGNDEGIPDTTIFDPATRTWTTGPPMATGRWYPTATTLPDGRVLATAGETGCLWCNALIPEVYDPVTGTWSSLTGASLSLPVYPHMFVLPDGRVVATGSQYDKITTAVLDVATRTWSTVDPGAVLDGGSSTMYVPGKILKSGSARHPDFPPAASAATTYVLDMTQPTPQWRQTPAMAFPRTQHNLTLLPDGTVLATGGGRNSNVNDVGAAVLEAELWSPATETWTTMAAMARPRLYHSSALLLPDGRVLVAGGGRYGVDEFTAQIYSPPYLFQGARPSITSAPAQIAYGAPFFVGTPDPSRIASVSLLRLGSVTHAFNEDQRFQSLTFTQSGGGVTIDAPVNGNLAPPGHYLLFLLDANGVPSVGRIVKIQ
jgi:hypothetical protein